MGGSGGRHLLLLPLLLQPTQKGLLAPEQDVPLRLHISWSVRWDWELAVAKWSALEKQRKRSRPPAASLASSHPLMLPLEYLRITPEPLS